ncbi:hypothetical protein F5884DRAFT_851569 [Xylogone sp. PMI_703]|nr:hypothetical protein F5884DRAFT_851569 [Xylogone sp. PMI_703]
MEKRRIQVNTSHEASPDVLSLLSQQLPFSLPVLRRLEFMAFSGGKTNDSHVLSCSVKEPGDLHEEFTVAYLDFSRGPETEMWLYSSIERGDMSVARWEQGEALIAALLHSIQEIEKRHGLSRETPGIVLVGSLHERIVNILESQGRVATKTVPHFKFIFKVEELPAMPPLPDEDLVWAQIKKEDIPLVLSRTSIPRREKTMILLPSAAVLSRNGSPIAWGFLGPDGSLVSLYCEEEYRGKGLAKAVAQKLFRERVKDFGADNFCHADVAKDNIQSQGVCKSLNGSATWTIYWVWIDIRKPSTSTRNDTAEEGSRKLLNLA